MVAECMQVVPINFEKSRRSLELAGGGGDEGCAGRAAPPLGWLTKAVSINKPLNLF